AGTFAGEKQGSFLFRDPRLAQQPAFLLQPAQTAFFYQLRTKLIVEREKIRGICSSIGTHLRAERPLAPIGFLVLLVQFNTETGLEQGSQTEFGNPQKSRGKHGIEKILYLYAEVPVERTYIVVCAMHHDLDAGIPQRRCQRRQIL